jgi:transposase
VAVRRVLEGRNREEQRAFVALRSHYLFESRFCTPGQGHEKGGVESGIGYVRRNFLVPLPNVPDFEALNAYLLAECQKDEARTVDRQPQTIGQAWRWSGRTCDRCRRTTSTAAGCCQSPSTPIAR